MVEWIRGKIYKTRQEAMRIFSNTSNYFTIENDAIPISAISVLMITRKRMWLN